MHRRGFSLIELMVVVAIIGILATLALPNYQKFKARSRQTAAKGELSGVFTAEKAFFAEYGSYEYQLPAIGFIPEGIIMGAGNNGYPGLANGIIRYYGTTIGQHPAPAPTPLVQLNVADPWVSSFSSGTGGNYPGNVGTCLPVSDPTPGNPNSPDNTDITALGAPLAAYLSQTSFHIHSVGCPLKNLSSAVGIDIWQIDDNKAMSNPASGL